MDWLNAVGIISGLFGTLLVFSFGSPFGARTRGAQHLELEQRDARKARFDDFQDWMSWLGVSLMVTAAVIAIFMGFKGRPTLEASAIAPCPADKPLCDPWEREWKKAPSIGTVVLSGPPLSPVAHEHSNPSASPPAFERYQTFSAAILGFGGIIVTLLANAALARRQAVETEARERAGLRRGLKAELDVIGASLKAAVETISLARTDGTPQILFPIGNITSIYDATHSRLGLLSDSEIVVLVRTYALIKELPNRIRLLSHSLDPEPTSRYIPVGSTLFSALEQLHAMVLGEVELAGAALRN
jgi:hypothetical protein